MASLMVSHKLCYDLTCNVKQSYSKQDFTICGETATSKYKFIIVCDGHGTSHTINYLRAVDWETLLDNQEFIPSLIKDINNLMNKTQLEELLNCSKVLKKICAKRHE